MKAKPFNRKYDVMVITNDTSSNEIGEFIKCPNAVRTKIYGIGFAAKRTNLINLNYGVVEVLPGNVLLRNSSDDITIISNDAYNMLFKTESYT